MPSMMMEVKGEKGDVGETGTKGFFGLKGQWSQKNKANTVRTMDHCLFPVTTLNTPRSSCHCASALLSKVSRLDAFCRASPRESFAGLRHVCMLPFCPSTSWCHVLSRPPAGKLVMYKQLHISLPSFNS